jgi:uncharacterized protein
LELRRFDGESADVAIAMAAVWESGYDAGLGVNRGHCWIALRFGGVGATLSSLAAVKPFFKAHPEGTLLFVKAQPRASRNEIGGAIGAELKVKITAPPVDSAANQAILEFLAEKLNCSKSAVTLLRGEKSRHKTVLLHGISPERAERSLAA